MSRRPRRPSVRYRILAWYVGLLVLATAVTIVIERRTLERQLDQRVAAELVQEVEELERLLGGARPDGTCRADRTIEGRCELGRDPTTGQPFDGDTVALFDTFLRRSIPGEHETMVTFVGGEHHASSRERRPIELATVPEVRSLAAAADREAALTDLETAVGPVRALAHPVRGEPGGVFVVAQFLGPQRADLDATARVAITANLLVLGVASLLAFAATGRLLRPVREVTATANAITETDLSRRIAVDTDDEIGRLAATFNDMLDRLEDAFAGQRRFFDDVGHELRTPITIVRGNLELLPEDPVRRARSVAIALDELDRMAGMVDDLLVLARAERPGFVVPAPTDLSVLLEEVREKARALGDRRWRTELGPEVDVVPVDPQRLTQALVQLAENAVRYTEPDDRITFGAARRGGQVHIWVRDEGAGIEPEDRDRLFARFERGRTPRGEGTGLGLSIVAAIAEGHGGRVEVDGRPGTGTTFTLLLPSGPATDR